MFLFNDRVVWCAHLPRSRVDREPADGSSRSYLIDEHPRDRCPGRERTSTPRDAAEMSAWLVFPRGERASRNGFRKLDALQSVARSARLPAARRLAVSTGHMEPVGQVRELGLGCSPSRTVPRRGMFQGEAAEEDRKRR